MIICNYKPILIVGYKQGSSAYEFVNEISKTHACQVIEPQNFFALENKKQYQYIACDWTDRAEKKQVLAVLDSQQLDLITVINDNISMGQTPAPDIQPGTYIGAFCHIGLASQIGRHCIINNFCQVGHFARLGVNCTLAPGTFIIGKSQVGNNCYFNARSMVNNKAIICDNVELMSSSALFKNVNVAGRYAGTPARLVKSQPYS